jgi:hypothetical protein
VLYVPTEKRCISSYQENSLQAIFIGQMNGPTLPAPLETPKEARAESPLVSRESKKKRNRVKGVEPGIWRYADCLTSMPFLKKWR